MNAILSQYRTLVNLGLLFEIRIAPAWHSEALTREKGCIAEPHFCWKVKKHSQVPMSSRKLHPLFCQQSVENPDIPDPPTCAWNIPSRVQIVKCTLFVDFTYTLQCSTFLVVLIRVLTKNHTKPKKELHWRV